MTLWTLSSSPNDRYSSPFSPMLLFDSTLHFIYSYSSSASIQWSIFTYFLWIFSPYFFVLLSWNLSLFRFACCSLLFSLFELFLIEELNFSSIFIVDFFRVPQPSLNPRFGRTRFFVYPIELSKCWSVHLRFKNY